MQAKPTQTVETIAQLHQFQSGSTLNLCIVQPHNTPQSCHIALAVFAGNPDGQGSHFEGEFAISPAKLGNRDSMESLLLSIMDEEHKPCAQTALANLDQAMPAMSEKLWELFGDIPTDCQDCLEIAFAGFSAGTQREDVWHWFESTFDMSVAAKMGCA